jgi:hypothetical protein
MVGMGLGAAAHHAVSHHRDNHRYHSHTAIESDHEAGRMDTDESHTKDEENTVTGRIQGPRDGLLPPPSERVLAGVLEKKTITSKGLHWRKRNAVLSRDYLSFGRVIEDW